jgi:hypothetical protein
MVMVVNSTVTGGMITQPSTGLESARKPHQANAHGGFGIDQGQAGSRE